MVEFVARDDDFYSLCRLELRRFGNGSDGKFLPNRFWADDAGFGRFSAAFYSRTSFSSVSVRFPSCYDNRDGCANYEVCETSKQSIRHRFLHSHANRGNFTQHYRTKKIASNRLDRGCRFGWFVRNKRDMRGPEIARFGAIRHECLGQNRGRGPGTKHQARTYPNG